MENVENRLRTQGAPESVFGMSTAQNKSKRVGVDMRITWKGIKTPQRWASDRNSLGAAPGAVIATSIYLTVTKDPTVPERKERKETKISDCISHQ